MKFLLLSIILCIGLCIAQNNTKPECAEQISGVSYFVQKGFCAWEYKTQLNDPRQLYVASNGDVLVSDSGNIIVLFDSNRNGVIENGESATLASADGLNHAVTVFGNYLYASSNSTVYRWKYAPGNRTDLGAPEVVLNNMPSDGHQTRTILMIADLKFFISIGSASNLDPDSSRSRVYVCDASNATLPITLSACEVQGDGNRNEVGLRYDPYGRVWGVENGMDNLQRPDLVADAHIDNPCEEVNLFDQKGAFYGYPRCWSEGILPANVSKGLGANWGVNKADDDWCFNQINVVRPKYCMGAHTAPLDLLFWNSTTFPAPYNTGLLVAQHGSWNRQPPSGYQVVHIQTDAYHNPVNNTLTKLFGGVPTASNGDRWPFRPVSVARLAPCTDTIPECLLISSDATGSIVAIRYDGGDDNSSNSSSSSIKPTIILISLVFIVISLFF